MTREQLYLSTRARVLRERLQDAHIARWSLEASEVKLRKQFEANSELLDTIRQELNEVIEELKKGGAKCLA